MLAAVTIATRRKPAEHIRTWRLRPLILLPPSQPRSPFWGPQRTLWLSTRPVRGSALRPPAARAAGVSARVARSHTPSRRKRSHHPRTVCQGGKSFGRAPPRRNLLRRAPPAAALGDEVEASVHDRPNGGAQRAVGREEGHSQCPFPVR